MFMPAHQGGPCCALRMRYAMSKAKVNRAICTAFTGIANLTNHIAEAMWRQNSYFSIRSTLKPRHPVDRAAIAAISHQSMVHGFHPNSSKKIVLIPFR